MKKQEILLWALVVLALIANIVVPKMRRSYSWKRDYNQRLAVDFDRTREDVKEYILQYIPDVTDGQIDEWTAAGKLENMEIGSKTMYFHNAAPNLFRIVPELVTLKNEVETRNNPAFDSNALSGHQVSDAQEIPIIKKAVQQNLRESSDKPFIADPQRMRVTFTLTVPANTLRKGSTLRCWLPFPRHDVDRQTGVKFIKAGVNDVDYPAEKIIFSDPSCSHSSLYMESKVRKNQANTFYEVFEYTSAGEWHPIDPASVLPYDTTSDTYKEYTAERDKHIVFTDRIKATADSLTAGISNPYLQAEAIYKWIDRFPWASAREYSTIENIPEYVLANGHGDCGQVTLLFMTLCRAKGIPTRWQSGLMLHPGSTNLHDWCEAYFEGFGWVPVDQSFGETPYGGMFYLGGIDPYRLIVNNDYGRAMSPKKKYPRSDTVDFQRGEVEWEGGNLYYHLWDYSFEVEYL